MLGWFCGAYITGLVFWSIFLANVCNPLTPPRKKELDDG